MAKLLGVSRLWGRIQKDWLHTDASGKDVITTETVTPDVTPLFKSAKQLSETQSRKSLLRFKAHIDGTVLEDMCRLSAVEWGVKPHQAFREVMQGKTDRAQRLIKTLTQGRDFRKFQAEKQAPRYVPVVKPEPSDGT